MKIEEIKNQLEKKKLENNLRTLKILKEEDLNLSSNDYLGIGQDKKLKEEFLEKYRDKILFSSSSSRLITGNYKIIRLSLIHISEPTRPY